MKKKICCSVFIIAAGAAALFGQMPTGSPKMSTPVQVLTPSTDLNTILTESEKQAGNYQETFKNLLATETKTFEEYDKNGNLKDQTSVESNFFVYQSAKSKNAASELRNIIKVDGKLVPDSQTRAERFLAELGKSKTAEKELEQIQDEGSRYDKTLKIDGLTLFEAISLEPALRPFFDFKLDAIENYQGREVYVVSYRQTKKTPLISINGKKPETDIVAGFDVDLPGALKKTDVLLRGTLMIDRQNFQLWREERQLVVQTPTPIVAMQTTLEYQASEFNILLPKKITLENYAVKKSKSDAYTAIKDTKVVYDYSKFRKFDVDVQILDDN